MVPKKLRSKSGFSGGSDGKESSLSEGDLDSIPGLGRSPGEGQGSSLQYSCLENSMDRRAWQDTVHGVAKSWIPLNDFHFQCLERGFPGGSDGKESACSGRDPGSIPGSGRFPGEGNGYSLQYSYLENSMDRGAWQATVHGVTNSRTQLSDNTFTFFNVKRESQTEKDKYYMMSLYVESKKVKPVKKKKQ